MLPIVLVHGGAGGAWCWEPLLPHMTSAAFALDLPPTSIRGVPPPNELPPELATVTLSDWSNAVLAFADDNGLERFVLAGHSLGGLTIADVVCRAPERVAHVVFVSALVPPDGSNAFDALPAEMIESINGPDMVGTMFCNDLDESRTQFVRDHIGTEAVQVMLEPISRTGWPISMPTTYVRLTRDAALVRAAQDASIAALGAGVHEVEIDAGHMVMISRPERLAAVLDEIATHAT
jgi:pimeloyl-ACP methyl ester carboxylesterase